ncbi:hypothetical protein [uncultured Psychroserpens sp.]|uniref:hypothetical protein n=1 Tax=uncultured Psychroserpens sp. TaxID=255436 RepID=UPI0026085867|nr:hypothetical protein [uncultured Psychroserpens sp.]
MRTSIHVNIPEPCHEDWDQMTANEKGRHCNSCNKTVLDFTSKTDEQIVKTFQTETNLCGRFKSSQLKRKLVLNRKEKNNYLSYIASTLFAFLTLGTQDVQAQGKPHMIKVDSSQYNSLRGKVGVSVLRNKMISITVFGKSKHRLPNAFVSLKGSSNKKKTNMAGDVSIKCRIGDILIIECQGYETITITIKQSSTYKVTLTPEAKVNSNLTGMVSSVNPEERQPNASNTLILGGIRSISQTNSRRKERRKLIRKGTIERTSIGNFLYNISSIFRRKE